MNCSISQRLCVSASDLAFRTNIVMTIPRVYIDTPLDSGITVELDARGRHHLVNVLRLKSGAPLVLFDGRGGEYEARLDIQTKKNVRAEVLGFREADCESPLKLHLVQAVARGDRMDTTLQKAVELGVDEITPVFSQRSTGKLNEHTRRKRMQHWRGIIISACEQSGRCRLPALHEPMPLSAFLERPPQKNENRYILAPGADTGLNPARGGAIALLVGPEGGFSGQEIETARRHHWTPVRLGPRTLRTETAGIVALALCQGLAGDLSK